MKVTSCIGVRACYVSSAEVHTKDSHFVYVLCDSLKVSELVRYYNWVVDHVGSSPTLQKVLKSIVLTVKT